MIVTEHRPDTLEDALFAIRGFDDGLPVVLLYIRVSSDIQVDEGFSLETQIERLRGECERRYAGGCHVIVAADEGLSGALWWKKDGLRSGRYRPGLTLVKDLVELRAVNAVGVYKCNRFTRKLRIWLEFLEDYLKPADIQFFSAEECIDTEDAASELVFVVQMSGAEFELSQISAGVGDGLKRRREEGYYVGEPPYGWYWEDERFVPEGRRINIEPIPGEAEVIRRIVDWYLSGKSPAWIAKELTAQQVPTARGRRVWHKAVVKRILANPTNAGLIWDRQGGLVEGLHFSQRVIEPETYHAVRERLKARREASADTNRPQDLVFDQLLTCGICGAQMQVSSPADCTLKYICPGRRAHLRHGGFSLSAEQLEARLEKVMLEAASADAVSKRAQARIHQEYESHEKDLRRELRRLKDRLASNESRICLWAGRAGDPEHDQQDVQTKLAALGAAHKELEKRLSEVKKESKRAGARKRRCEAATALLRQVPKMWERMSLGQKRELVSHLLESLVCIPTPTGVTVRVVGLPAGDRDIRFFIGGKAEQGHHDLWAITAQLLTTAYYLRQGLSIKQIAEARGITSGVVASQLSKLRWVTGFKKLADVIHALAPVLDARADELFINGKTAPKRPGRPKRWTPRQLQLLKLKISGHTQQQIAREMGITLSGMLGIQVRVYRKLGAHSAAQAAEKARELGII